MPRSAPLRSAVLTLSVLLLCAPVIAWSRFDFVNGGHGWRQGDWLINFGAGPIRRGLIGEVLIALSDATGLSLLITTLVVQVAIFAAVAIALWRIALRHPAPALMLLLVASPAFFLTFFAANPMGSMRKELFGVLALALLTLAAIRQKQGLFLPVLAVIAYSIGCIGNVLHVFMLPALILALYLLYTQTIISRATLWTLGGLSAAMALFWLGFALRFSEVSNLPDICAPLLARGFDMEICNHAIRWLVSGEVDHFAQVAQRLTIGAVPKYASIAVVCLIPLALCLVYTADSRFVLTVLALCFLPLLPLYVTATDWGRWLSLSYTASVLLLLQANASRRLPLVRQPGTFLLVALLAISLLIAPEHTIGWRPLGAIPTIIETIGVFL